MKIAKTVREMRSLVKNSKRPIGLVPTMGSLHKGHEELIKRARLMCKTVAVSIFVNPTQFAPNEDLNSYPRNFVNDRNLCIDNGADILFYPPIEEIYPDNFSTTVKVNKLTEVLEGKSRPSHFEGVTTIVAKLFMMIMPDFAFFGKKDAQQLIVIQKMTDDLNMPISIIPVETVRKPNGLAYSSRNSYLNEKQRREAVVLYNALMRAKTIVRTGEKRWNVIKKEMENEIGKSKEAKIDYISCSRTDNLAELNEINENNSLISLAVFFDKTRLIDNIWL
ncbi:MAG TPA: pantoate--beta-alanine ligase [Deltaproteobacteria bacterium]|nr:pantoate--beta-alanine ligase [Deltaproteobacteria bacterium]